MLSRSPRSARSLGIEAIVTGSIADLGSDVKINGRAISVESAKVFAAASAKIPKTDTVQQLMRQNAGQAALLSASAPASRVAQRSDVYFQNDFLRVDISSAALSKAKDRLTLSLILQNTSSQEILVAMDKYGGCLARVVDNSGIVAPSDNGGAVMVTGVRCLDWRERPENYARLSPGAKTPIVLAFETEREEPFGGGPFSFSAEFLRLDGGSYSRFTIGLSDIAVRD